VEAVLRLTGGRGADVAFEATRSAQNFPRSLRLAALNGRIVVVQPGRDGGNLAGRGTPAQGADDHGGLAASRAGGAHHTFPWSQQRNRQVYLELARAGTLRVDIW
jgi:threonine dehydrogenase-like Zn-dependent dehydrogenase